MLFSIKPIGGDNLSQQNNIMNATCYEMAHQKKVGHFAISGGDF
jgi:hypothetical protein